MALARDELLVLGAAGALRLLLFAVFPALHDILTQRVEISTPINSFKRLQEGLFLYRHDISPYDGGVYHQAPLFLPLLSLLPDYAVAPFWTNLLYTLTDLSCAHALVLIARSGRSACSPSYTSPRKHLKWTPAAVAGAFLFNPFTIATCLAQPSSVFTNCAVLWAIATANDGNIFHSIFALSLASYFSLYPILLSPPLALLTYDRWSTQAHKPTSQARFFAGYIFATAGHIAAILVISYIIIGSSWEFIMSTYGAHVLLSDLTPNIGLWWYFFIEMFDSFRNFFLCVFWLHMSSYVCGFSIRLRSQPLFAITSLLGIFAIFKPYPSIADASLYFGLLPIYRHVFPLFRYGFIAAAALLYATFLGPAFYYLWIYAGSGNANFFYAITLVWSLGLTIVIGDSIWAVLRDEAEAERPELRGKKLKQI